VIVRAEGSYGQAPTVFATPVFKVSHENSLISFRLILRLFLHEILELGAEFVVSK
jgi:hypothetical protein